MNKKILVSVLVGVVILVLIILCIMVGTKDDSSYGDYVVTDKQNDELIGLVKPDTVTDDITEESVLMEYDEYTLLGDSFLEELGIRVKVYQCVKEGEYFLVTLEFWDEGINVITQSSDMK